MALNAKKALAASKSYTDETVVGGGALKGKNCVINSISDIAATSQKPAGKRVTFGWTLDDGTAQTGTMDVYNGEDGQGIDRMYVNAEGHLVVVYDDGTEEDVGEITIPDFQADWDETDPSENSYIKNKPTIPAAQVNSDWNAVSGVAEILHKPTIPTKVSELQNDSGFEANTIESISVNGTAVTPDANKNVNIVVQGGGGTSDYSDLTNKPSINNVTLSGNKTASDLGLATPSDIVQSDWNESDNTSKAYIANKPTIPAAQEQADWNEADSTDPAYIKNKPSLGTAAAKDSTNAVTANSTDLVESGAVKTAIDTAVASAYHHAGTKTVAELLSSLLVAANEGDVYNMTDAGTTTADFIEGAGKPIKIGDNVGIAKVGENSYKFDLLSGFVDTSTFIEKSNTAGLVKNDGTIDTTSYVSDISGKADKVSGATSGNFAGLDSNGNLTDSGSKASDFLTSHQDISGKTDLTNIAPVEASSTASKAYAQGDRLIYNGQLYKASTAITQGDTLTVGTNITATTVDAEIKTGGGGTGGHTIEDDTGTDMTARANLQFIGASVSDDSTNDRTIVNISGKADVVDLATAFDTATAYTVGQYVTYNGDLYRCTTNHSAGAWDGTHFTAVTVGNEMYYNQPWSGTTTAWAALSATEKAKYKEVHFTNDASNSIVDTVPTSGSANLVQSGGVFSAIAAKANDADVVKLTGTQTVGGVKTFTDWTMFKEAVTFFNSSNKQRLGMEVCRYNYSTATFYGLETFAETDGYIAVNGDYHSSTSPGYYEGAVLHIGRQGTNPMYVDDFVDALTIDTSTGNVGVAGVLTVSGSDYAEHFKTIEDVPMYRMVTLDGEIAKLAQADTDIEDIIGITSENPAIVGGRDTTGVDVGLIGKLWVEHDGTAVVNGYVKSGDNGIATRAKKGEGYRVMTVDGDKCRVLVK